MSDFIILYESLSAFVSTYNTELFYNSLYEVKISSSSPRITSSSPSSVGMGLIPIVCLSSLLKNSTYSYVLLYHYITLLNTNILIKRVTSNFPISLYL